VFGRTSFEIRRTYPFTPQEEALMRSLEIDCTKPLELPKQESRFGIVLTLASVIAATSVCSALVNLTVAQ
jgi:hypothetical protein